MTLGSTSGDLVELTHDLQRMSLIKSYNLKSGEFAQVHQLGFERLQSLT